jgi:hypothetical protein
MLLARRDPHAAHGVRRAALVTPKRCALAARPLGAAAPKTMPQKTARENEIARENGPPHGNDDMAVLRDDELDAITGGVEDNGR